MTEPTEKEPTIKKAFVSGKTDSAILEYFKRRSKRSINEYEKIAEIDRRYFPVGKFHIKNVQKGVEVSDYAYLNLNTGELYHIRNHGIHISNYIKKTLELSEDARKAMFDLISAGRMELERFGSRNIADILEKNGLAKIYVVRKPGILDEVLAEILAIVRDVSDGISEIFSKPSTTKKPVTSTIPVVEKVWIRKKTAGIKIDRSNNLDNFIHTGIPESRFDADKVLYNPDDVAKVLANLLKRNAVYEETIYMPYYKCKYTNSKGARYLTFIAPKFKR